MLYSLLIKLFKRFFFFFFQCSSYRDVEIIYKASKRQIKNKGFKLEYSKADCSYNYTSLQGRVIHEDIKECWVTIKVPKNYTINIYFNQFKLLGSNDCSEGHMQVILWNISIGKLHDK